MTYEILLISILSKIIMIIFCQNRAVLRIGQRSEGTNPSGIGYCAKIWSMVSRLPSSGSKIALCKGIWGNPG